jgi:hypothetical protein
MFGLNLTVGNPWDKSNDFNSLYEKSGLLSKFKAWEFQVMKYSGMYATVEFTFTHRCDHAGPSLEIGAFGYSIAAKIYDTRHWNTGTNSW